MWSNQRVDGGGMGNGIWSAKNKFNNNSNNNNNDNKRNAKKVIEEKIRIKKIKDRASVSQAVLQIHI